jgi:ribosomal protein S18 acetylase RimI-like enzyme
MLDIDIRPVNDENVDFQKILHVDNFSELFSDSYYEAACRGFTMASFLAYQNREVVGEIMLEWKLKQGQLVVYITSLSVSESHRRKGIANRLLSHIKEESWDASCVYLHTQENNFAAQSLYHKAGFVAKRRVANYYSSENLDAIVFEWTNPCQCEPIDHRYIYEHLQFMCANKHSHIFRNRSFVPPALALNHHLPLLVGEKHL